MGTEESKTYQGYIDLSDSENSTAEKLSELLVGQSVGGDLSIVVDTYIEYPQVMADFDTVKIKEINGFVTSKLVVAFRFVNEELRDPFYGDSIYENQLEGNNKNYGLSDNVCQTVLPILGGLGESSTSSNGFIGVETVAVGLNPDTMEKYGLYAENAYKIRFVLPRGVEDLVDENEQEFFTWASELGFNLYISEEQDGYRYVASDMYDIVAKVKASDLVFLNYGFVDFWARRTPMLLDVKNIASMKLDFNMSNVYGSYNFEMKHTDYYYDMNGKPHSNYQEGYTKDVFIELFVTEGEGSMHTALTDYIRETGEARVDFSKFYGGGEDEWIDYDTSDVSYFKDVMMILFLTNYVDMVSDEERASAMEHEPLMTMELSLKGKADKYIYEFRRFNERQIMVTIKCCAPDGAVRYESSDFYISSAVTREIVSGFVYLLNGKEIDPDIFYEELPLAE